MHDDLDVRRERRLLPSPERACEVRPLGDVLAELLAQYEARFPNLHIAIVETTPAAA